MNLSFGQKLLVAFGILLLLVMGAFTLSGNLRLQETTDTYVDALTCPQLLNHSLLSNVG
ncbi:hypothetical protein MTMN5_03589 [Marinobacter salarius]|nr:hypothetical protein MTMN5_03589 [Marinobacter salarius]